MMNTDPRPETVALAPVHPGENGISPEVWAALAFPDLGPESKLSQLAIDVIQNYSAGEDRTGRIKSAFTNHYNEVKDGLLAGEPLEHTVNLSRSRWLGRLNQKQSWSYGHAEIKACRRVIKQASRLFLAERQLHFRDIYESRGEPVPTVPLSERILGAARKVVGITVSRG
jgi:hypothetical protein